MPQSALRPLAWPAVALFPFLLAVACPLAAQSPSAPARHPAIARYYTFETVTPARPVAPSVAGEQEALTYAGADPFTVVAGRRPGTKAVRMDRGCFQGKPFGLAGKACTIEMWVRKHGQGRELGNGRENGMLLAQGGGYWDGLRLWTQEPQDDLHFEIGRPQPSSAVGVQAAGPVPEGAWHHLAAAWDGREMWLYINGLPAAVAPYEGDYTAPGAPLKIGMAGAGIGSVRLDVDEVAIYKAALRPEEILAHAHEGQSPPAGLADELLVGAVALARRNWSGAEAVLAEVAYRDELPPEFQAMARLALARAMLEQHKTVEAARIAATLFDAPKTAPRYREIAARMALAIERGAWGAPGSKDLYQQLLESPNLTPADRVRAQLALAERLLRDGDVAGARALYEEILKQPGLPPSDAWDVRLQMAHAHLAARQYAEARAAYQQLAQAADAPPQVRADALLSIGHAATRQKDYAAASAAFARAAQAADMPPHLADEARERAVESQRLAQGQPARDPAASRTKLPPLPKPGIVCYVAPDGNDANPGSQARPFATLPRARDAIREYRQKNGMPQGGVAVAVRGGDYPVRETLELTAADSGTAESPIVYRAWPNERPRFTGGVSLTGFAPVSDPVVLARLPEEARGKIVQLDLKAQGISDFGAIGQRGFGLSGYPAHPWVDLYVSGRPMTLARWPNEGFVEVGKVHKGEIGTPDAGAPGEFEYIGDRPARWTAARDAWMFGYWGHLWEGRTVRIAAIDGAQRRIRTEHATSYGFREKHPYYAFNLLEEIDQPGEWHLDRESGILYLYPPGDIGQAKVEFPLLGQPFVRLKGVSHVWLRGLAMECGRAEGVVIEGGSGVVLAGCTLGQLGTNGVIVAGGDHHGLLGCDIHTLGAGGVRIRGGDPKTLTPGGHFIENCHIRDFTRVDRVYAPAVQLEGVGNRVAHNLMHDSPHHAMRVEGYEHQIEYNEVHSVVYESDDQSGIDIYGNPAYRGIVIRYNFWHHIGSGRSVAGQAGIRLDDFISRVLMYGNVFYRSAGGRFGGIQIHGGKDNIVDNNLFIECKSALSFSPWGQKRWEDRLADPRTRQAMAQGGVDITQPPHATRYPDLAQMRENADRNFIWRSAVVDCGRLALRENGKNELMDNCLFEGEVGFANPAARDFALKDDSPIYDRFGFRPIPFAEIGLYADEHRAVWPVKHEISRHYVREF